MFLLVEYNNFDRNLAPSQMQGCRLVFKGGGAICGYFYVHMRYVCEYDVVALLACYTQTKELYTSNSIGNYKCVTQL